MKLIHKATRSFLLACLLVAAKPLVFAPTSTNEFHTLQQNLYQLISLV